MKKSFSTKYIYSDERGHHVMKTSTGKVIPGRPFTIDGNENVALAGGFPDLSPDTPFFLSPTLQLNVDSGVLSEKQLLALTKAELARFQAIKYRTYTVEVNPRVCVISRDADTLDKFVDTYGGILEIEALLLNGSNPEYPLVTELDFEVVSDGWQLCYRKRSPVKQENCSYCGKCGAVCPERCISPRLYVDYSSCTFCKECEKVCGDAAMDIYGIEEVTFQVPAVILLGQTGLEVPEKSTGIYLESQLPEFFKTVYTAEIKEVVCHNNSICQYSSKLGLGCARCVDSCAHGALSRGKTGIVIDHVECRECGNCMAVCPTGAMQNGNFDDAALVRYLQNIEYESGLELVLGAEKQLHELWWRKCEEDGNKAFYLEYSTLASLSYFHLLLFYASGFQRITLLGNDTGYNLSSLKRQIATANEIVRSLFNTDFARIVAVEDYLAGADESVPTPPVFQVQLGVFENRRALLSSLLKQFLTISEETLTTEQLGDDFLAITCNAESCTQCMACLNECKMNALEADRDQLSLTYQAGLCVGCGVCVKVCPEKALSTAADETIDKNFFDKRVFAKAEAVNCKKCGKVFGTRKSLDRVMQILSARESVNTDHFEYCSDCRVVKLFEEQEA